VAREHDNRNLFEELKAKQQELDDIRSQVVEDLEGQLQHVVTQMEELGIPLPQFIVDKVIANVEAKQPKAVKLAAATEEVADKKERQPRSCKICQAAGLKEEAKGHIAKTHYKWLERQPGNIKAHFKGTLTDGGAEPRLVEFEASKTN